MPLAPPSGPFPALLVEPRHLSTLFKGWRAQGVHVLDPSRSAESVRAVCVSLPMAKLLDRATADPSDVEATSKLPFSVRELLSSGHASWCRDVVCEPPRPTYNSVASVFSFSGVRERVGMIGLGHIVFFGHTLNLWLTWFNLNLRKVALLRDGNWGSRFKDLQVQPFKYIELFAGIGGFRVGLDCIGGQCVFASEIHPTARQAYMDNFKHQPHGDICLVGPDEIPAHDLLTAGFPCQPFTSVGQKQGFDEGRGLLFFQIVRVLRSHQPACFLLENVPGLLKHRCGTTMNIILLELTAAGYAVKHRIMNTSPILPQRRKRVYIVGIRQDLARTRGFSFPILPELNRTLREILEPESDFTARHVLTDKLWAKCQGISLYQTHPERVVVGPDGQAATITRGYHDCVDNFVRTCPGKPRFFTPRECARAQGFPETFVFPHGQPKSTYRLVGNAVAPPMVALLAAHLMTAVQSGRQASNLGFQELFGILRDALPEDLQPTFWSRGVSLSKAFDGNEASFCMDNSGARNGLSSTRRDMESSDDEETECGEKAQEGDEDQHGFL